MRCGPLRLRFNRQRRSDCRYSIRQGSIVHSQIVCLLVILAAAAQGAEIVIYGGSAAGVMAAVSTARQGHDVLLVAPEKHLGGMVVEGLGSADINNHWFRNDVVLGGLTKEFYQRLGKKYGAASPVYQYESSVAESVVEELLREQPRIEILREARLRAVRKRGSDITGLELENGRLISGRVFLDATIEGDLLAAAGVSTVVGREANAKYGETKNGIRAETTHAQFKVRVDPYQIPGDPKSGLIPTIQDEALGTPGDGDRNLQAYCFRICLTRRPENRRPIEKPEGFRRADYEIYFRYVQAGGKLWTPAERLPNGKTDLGSWHDLSANLYGMNREWPEGNAQKRAEIYRYHLRFTQGLLWILQNDPAIPEETRKAWRDWGLTKDEFTDNGGWPRQLYVRDARRMVSDLVLTEHHTRRINPEPIADPIAVAFWPTDTHSVRRIVRDGAAYNEGFVFDDNNWGPFGISYRSLVPKRQEATNLLTPTCVSSSHVAYGAIRLEHTFMSLGEAAAHAAVLALERKADVQDVPYTELRRRLLAQGQILSVALVPAK